MPLSCIRRTRVGIQNQTTRVHTTDVFMHPTLYLQLTMLFNCKCLQLLASTCASRYHCLSYIIYITFDIIYCKQCSLSRRCSVPFLFKIIINVPRPNDRVTPFSYPPCPSPRNRFSKFRAMAPTYQPTFSTFVRPLSREHPPSPSHLYHKTSQ